VSLEALVAKRRSPCLVAVVAAQRAVVPQVVSAAAKHAQGPNLEAGPARTTRGIYAAVCWRSPRGSPSSRLWPAMFVPRYQDSAATLWTDAKGAAEAAEAAAAVVAAARGARMVPIQPLAPRSSRGQMGDQLFCATPSAALQKCRHLQCRS